MHSMSPIPCRQGLSHVFMLVLFTVFFLPIAVLHAEEKKITLDIFLSKKKEAWMKASVHAINNKEVGIAIYGHATDATAKQIGEFLKARLAAKGIGSKYFLAMEDKEGAMVGFYIMDVAYGPTDPDGVPKNLELVIDHFPQAWGEDAISAELKTANR